MGQQWASINRGKGQSVSSWLRANHNYHLSIWKDEKVRNGTWLPKATFEKLTGRIGRS
jgi:hypothetical protein